MCSKFRTVDTDVDRCRGEIKKVCILGRLSFDEVGKSQTKWDLDIPTQATT